MSTHSLSVAVTMCAVCSVCTTYSIPVSHVFFWSTTLLVLLFPSAMDVFYLFIFSSFLFLIHTHVYCFFLSFLKTFPEGCTELTCGPSDHTGMGDVGLIVMLRERSQCQASRRPTQGFQMRPLRGRRVPARRHDFSGESMVSSIGFSFDRLVIYHMQ